MYDIRRFSLAALLLGALAFFPTAARAAESYDNCTGFVDTVPATISQQGVWCLRHDVTTAIISGAAITIAANNVTLDCNEFKIGGLAAGNTSHASGIYAYDRINATIRNCNVRGFVIGIYLQYGDGYLIEDNRLDNNLSFGIAIDAINNEGSNNIVRRNRVYDTGGSQGSHNSRGIDAAADIIENVVSGVFADIPPQNPSSIVIVGIWAKGSGNVVRGNIVRGLAINQTGFAVGIFGTSDGIVNDNHISSSNGIINGEGIYGYDAFCSNNTVANFSTAFARCTDAGGNVSN